MSRKLRKTIAGSLFAVALATGTVAVGVSPASALDSNTNTTPACVEGTYGKDRWGNVYKCIGGKWVLWSMPAYTLTYAR